MNRPTVIKRPTVIALVLAAVALPVCAQHGGGHGGGGGVSSHSSMGSHGSFAGARIAPAFSSHIAGYASSAYRNPGIYRRPTSSRRDYPGIYPGYAAYPSYGYSGYAPYLDPGPAYDNEAAAPVPYMDAAPQQPLPQADYQPSPQTRQTQPESQPNEATLLIFKDGHMQQVQNYMATRTTLTIFDGPRHHDIAITDLDLSATIQANLDGVGFQLPAGH